MRALIQRVHRASVTVDTHCVGEIEHGLLAYIGLGHDDNLQSAQRMIDKIITYRIWWWCYWRYDWICSFNIPKRD